MSKKIYSLFLKLRELIATFHQVQIFDII